MGCAARPNLVSIYDDLSALVVDAGPEAGVLAAHHHVGVGEVKDDLGGGVLEVGAVDCVVIIVLAQVVLPRALKLTGVRVRRDKPEDRGRIRE